MSSNGSGESIQQLSWLINGLVQRVPHARSALLLSADGLVRAHTQDLAKDDADHLAAIASGLWSLASGAGRKFAGGEAVRQVRGCCARRAMLSSRPTASPL